MTDNSLDQLLKLVDYAAQRKRLFPSDSSLQWFVRTHRRSLIDSGALLWHCGQWHAHIDRFDDYVLEASKQAAARKQSEAL